MVSCQGCGKNCEKSMCCPRCTEMGRSSFFCSQECFRKNWPAHNKLHAVIKKSHFATAAIPVGGGAGSWGSAGSSTRPSEDSGQSARDAAEVSSSILQRKTVALTASPTTIGMYSSADFVAASGGGVNSTASTVAGSAAGGTSAASPGATSGANVASAAPSPPQPPPVAPGVATDPNWWKFAIQRQVDKVFRSLSAADKFGKGGSSLSLPIPTGTPGAESRAASGTASAGAAADAKRSKRALAPQPQQTTVGLRMLVLLLLCGLVVVAVAKRSMRRAAGTLVVESEPKFDLPPSGGAVEAGGAGRPSNDFKANAAVLAEVPAAPADARNRSGGEANGQVEALQRSVANQAKEIARLKKLLEAAGAPSGEAGIVQRSGVQAVVSPEKAYEAGATRLLSEETPAPSTTDAAGASKGGGRRAAGSVAAEQLSADRAER